MFYPCGTIFRSLKLLKFCFNSIIYIRFNEKLSELKRIKRPFIIHRITMIIVEIFNTIIMIGNTEKCSNYRIRRLNKNYILKCKKFYQNVFMIPGTANKINIVCLLLQINFLSCHSNFTYYKYNKLFN